MLVQKHFSLRAGARKTVLPENLGDGNGAVGEHHEKLDVCYAYISTHTYTNISILKVWNSTAVALLLVPTTIYGPLLRFWGYVNSVCMCVCVSLSAHIWIHEYASGRLLYWVTQRKLCILLLCTFYATNWSVLEASVKTHWKNCGNLQKILSIYIHARS